MCGSLKLEGQRDKLFVRGQRIPIENLEIDDDGSHPNGYMWDGHARSDGAIQDKTRTLKKQWLDRGYEPATIKGVNMFTERKKLNDGRMQNTEINLGNRAQIGALINRERGILVILTRPARTDTEKEIHHRFPVYVKNREHLIQALNKKFR